MTVYAVRLISNKVFFGFVSCKPEQLFSEIIHNGVNPYEYEFSNTSFKKACSEDILPDWLRFVAPDTQCLRYFNDQS